MISKSIDLPVYAKLAQILIGLVAFFYVLCVGQEIIVPLLFSLILAILLNPLVNYLMRKKVNRLLAIFMTLFALIICFVLLGFFIGSQISLFTDSFPQFKVQFLALFNEVRNWIAHTFNISQLRIDTWINQAKSAPLNSSSEVLGTTINTINTLLVIFLLVPVYIFMILFYKPLLLEFISKLFVKEQHTLVAEVLMETRGLIQSYLIGLLLELGLVAVLNSVGFLLIGLDYAILLGIICALLNIIPYIGGLVGIMFPFTMGLATIGPRAALLVIVVYLVVQFIDNNIIVPKVVASQVKVNALVSIVVVLIGGALWGVAGMFLSIPLTAIVKVIFDRIEPLKPFGFLIGDNQPEIGKVIFKFRKIRLRKRTL